VKQTRCAFCGADLTTHTEGIVPCANCIVQARLTGERVGGEAAAALALEAYRAENRLRAELQHAADQLPNKNPVERRAARARAERVLKETL